MYFNLPNGDFMKQRALITLLIATTFFAVACDSSSSKSKGTLSFRTTVWNAENEPELSGKLMAREAGEGEALHVLDVVNIRHLISEIEITTDSIEEGKFPEDISWILLYESSKEILHTDREITIQVPVGEYKGFRITQRNLIKWVVEFDNDFIDLPTLNDDTLGPNATIVNYFGEDSLYEIDEETGEFVKNPNDELLGTFEVKAGRTTYLTMQVNINSLHWHDNNDNGIWDDGDEVDEISAPEGVLTMTDFIVEND